MNPPPVVMHGCRIRPALNSHMPYSWRCISYALWCTLVKMSDGIRIRFKRVNRKKRKAGLATLRKFGRQHFSKASKARRYHRGGRPKGRRPLVQRT